jgi:prepilin-type N-terminal cleavage/methylation domain-containing protein
MEMNRRGQEHNTSNAGFSLIELTIVVALVGMLAMVGFPTMQDWLDRYRVRTSAEQLASMIQLQRMRAVSQNGDFSIEFDAAAGSYQLYQGTAATGTALNNAWQLPTGVDFSGDTDPVNVPNDEIISHADGSLNDSTATTDQIFLGNGEGDVFLIAINRATGRVEVQHQSYGY